MTSFSIPNHHKKIILEFASYFTERGKLLYLVGGSIRDGLIGKPLYDYDYCTNALPQEVILFFKETKARVIKTGIKHGTVTVRFRGMAFEVTTFRTESDYSDFRHPDKIEFARTIEEDLSRRDFTINSIALKLPQFEFFDPYGGIDDIKAKRLAAIGEPKDRFNEDALRILRLFRFMAKLDFSIDPKTLEGAIACKEKLKFISAERIRMELEKLLLTDNPTPTLELMQTSGVLQEILPELSNCYGITQNRYHKWDVFYHSLYTLQEMVFLTKKMLQEASIDPQKKATLQEDILHLRWAALLHDIGKPLVKKVKQNPDGSIENSFHQHDKIGSEIAKEILLRLKCPNKTIERVSLFISKHMILQCGNWSDKTLKKWMASLQVENLELFYLLVAADRKAHRGEERESEDLRILKSRIQKILKNKEPLTLKELKISGNELITKGFEKGPKMGKILAFLLDKVLENPDLNEKETLFDLAQKIVPTIKDSEATKMNNL